MANRPNEEPPEFKRGQVLTAKSLNALASSIIKRLVGVFPIRVRQGASGHLTISMESSPDTQTASVDPSVLAKIESEVGSGVYRFSTYKGDGPAGTGNVCTELNISTGISVGTKVVCHKADGSYYFFFPVTTV